MMPRQPLPKFGRSPEALFDFFEQHILPHAMGNQHPRFAAWVNPAAAPIGMLAEFLAAVPYPCAAWGAHAPLCLWHCRVGLRVRAINDADHCDACLPVVSSV